jgi:hypothetical protein
MLPIVGGLAALVIIGLVVVMGGGKDDQGGSKPTAGNTPGTPGANDPGQTPAPTTETLADIKRELAANPPTTPSGYKAYAARLKKVSADAEVKELYKQGIEGGTLYDDSEARSALGHKKFEFDDVEIGNDQYPFIQAAKKAARKRWFLPDEDEELALANKAKAETEAHVKRLQTDRTYRAGDQIRAFIKNSRPKLRQYNFSMRWAAPYLICYATKERVSEFDLMEMPREERRKKLEEMAKSRKRYDRILDEKAKIYQQLYERFMSTYKERLGLGDLSEEWGGRPDYPQNYRTYKDGCPLIVWIFDTKESWREYHNEVIKSPIPEFAAGYFESQYGWVYLYDEKGDGGRRFEIGKNLHEGCHQLQFWFNKQMTKWRQPYFQQDWLGEGLAEYHGAANMDKQRNLEFHGMNVPRLQEMRRMVDGMKKANKEYPIFPLRYMIQFKTYQEMQNWGAREWGIPQGMVMGLFYQQSWAFMHFLHEYEGGKYREKFNVYFDNFLRRPPDDRAATRAFRQAFKFHEDEDWEDIQKEFEAYIKDFLMKVDLTKYAKPIPSRGDWGDAVEVDDDE